MEVLDGKHAGPRQWDWSHVGRCRSTSRLPIFEVKTLMTPDYTVLRCTALGRIESDLVGLKGNVLADGRHEKAPVRYSCSRLAALRCAPRTHWCCISGDHVLLSSFSSCLPENRNYG